MVVGEGLEPSKGVLHLRLDRVLTMGEKERLQGMFYHNPTVDANRIYQNSELSKVRIDMDEVGS